jgi:hypothetical protein
MRQALRALSPTHTNIALTSADGHKSRIAVGSSTPLFLVVGVKVVDAGTPREFKRAYLLRHSA